MNLVWMYFTFAEHVGVAAGQQTEEFVVLAAKFWGEFSAGFWIMIFSMVAALFILVVPRLLPDKPIPKPLFQKKMGIAFSGGAVAVAALMFGPGMFPELSVWADLSAIQVSLSNSLTRTIGWTLLIFLIFFAGLGFSRWLQRHPVAATVIASAFVLLGMWLERWNIIVPTMTHPRLIPYTTYTPTLTEWALTAASFALFCLMFLIFFRIFPAVSIWEIAEGKVIQKAESKIVIPPPEPSAVRKKTRRWGYKIRGRGG